MACRYSPAMTRESGERIEVAGLQRKKQASNPIYWKFSRVESYVGAFFVLICVLCTLFRRACFVVLFGGIFAASSAFLHFYLHISKIFYNFAAQNQAT